MEIKAAVVREPHGKFSIEALTLAEPNADEILVRLVATGVCHTDLSVVDQIVPIPLPIVLGHEGAGVVEKIGDAVAGIKVGDHVVLTFASCGSCGHCATHHPAYCDGYMPLNFGTRRCDGTSPITDKANNPVNAAFFSQSSFATYAITSPSNTVVVRKDAPLALLGPLGCGLNTGAGVVLNVLKPAQDSTFAVFGAGAVGAAALMAAKHLGVKTIIAIDRVESRLALALEIGATHTIDTSKENLADALAALGGLDNALDTSGVPSVIETAVYALKTCGTLVLVGAGKDPNLHLSILPLISGKNIRGVVNGDCEPHKLIPELVDMYMAGGFPIDRISSYYPFEDINQAVADSHSGKSIKPILTF